MIALMGRWDAPEGDEGDAGDKGGEAIMSLVKR